ncbi:hypothetical protein PYCCODRAFT_1437777 [Trametes coccinea BRFM310]|uniref:Uncharacterized protein n=1 Tax=Trametes coccinea (strain BRFM310) TaxID=1353009 RepID=A0A1Y2IG14_TRAC3|nr:hypothetical protein PYCCODRAFT_1437777 [Trametes coccinea BRFM310]
MRNRQRLWLRPVWKSRLSLEAPVHGRVESSHVRRLFCAGITPGVCFIGSTAKPCTGVEDRRRVVSADVFRMIGGVQRRLVDKPPGRVRSRGVDSIWIAENRARYGNMDSGLTAYFADAECRRQVWSFWTDPSEVSWEVCEFGFEAANGYLRSGGCCVCGRDHGAEQKRRGG